MVKLYVPELTPAATFAYQEAVYTPCTNNPIQSPFPDFDGAVQVTDMVE